MNDKLKKAIEKVSDKLCQMPSHEFKRELEKHKDGEIALMIRDLIKGGWRYK